MSLLTAIALVLLTAPTFIILLSSFSAGETLRFPLPGLSLRWYAALLELPELLDAALNSLLVAMLATVVSVGLGVSAALAIANQRSGWAKAVEALVMSPLALPALSVGLALLLLINLVGWRLSITTLAISHVVVCMPYLVRTTLASLTQLDPSLEQASSSLGANSLYTFYRITLPLIGQGIVAGSFITFLTSFDNITVSLFLTDARTQLLPIRMWSLIQNSLDVRAAAVSAILVSLTAGLILVLEQFFNLSRYVVGDRFH